MPTVRLVGIVVIVVVVVVASLLAIIAAIIASLVSEIPEDCQEAGLVGFHSCRWESCLDTELVLVKKCCKDFVFECEIDGHETLCVPIAYDWRDNPFLPICSSELTDNDVGETRFLCVSTDAETCGQGCMLPCRNKTIGIGACPVGDDLVFHPYPTSGCVSCDPTPVEKDDFACSPGL